MYHCNEIILPAAFFQSQEKAFGNYCCVSVVEEWDDVVCLETVFAAVYVDAQHLYAYDEYDKILDTPANGDVLA